MSFLNLENKTFLVFGVANKKSIAYHTAQTLEAQGATIIYSVRSQKRKDELTERLKDKPIYICDFENPADIQNLVESVKSHTPELHGILHSVAFANYSEGFKPFHETNRQDFLQATSISAFSLVEIANAFKPLLHKDASVVAISISSQVTAETYGYMSPIKAALDSASRFLAKSFSADTNIRFNTVNAGPLKTSASAGIPGYLENYLYAEKMTLRKSALTTKEVANTATFLLSPASSGINAQSIVVNAGMDINYFDKELVEAATKLN